MIPVNLDGVNTTVDDLVLEDESVTNSIASIDEANAGTDGAFEDIGFDGSDVITVINDDSDNVTVVLSATPSTSEDGGSIVYTASLVDDNGDAVTTANAITVNLTNGETITIAATASSGDSAAVPVNLDDVYLDTDYITNSITSISEANAGSEGAFEDIGFDGSTVSTTVVDDNDPTSVILTGEGSVVEGGTITYTASIVGGNAPDGPLTFNVLIGHIDTESGDFLTTETTVTIPSGQLSATFDFIIADDGVTTEGPEDYTVTLTGPINGDDGNYESLDLSGARLTTTILDIQPSTAYLTVNTSNTGGGGTSGDQSFDITITSPDGTTNTTTPTSQPEEGQQDIVLEFDNNVEFAAGDTYTVVMEHTGGAAHTNVTDLTLVDKFGNEVVLNDTGGNNNTTLTDDDGSSYDGIIYTVHIDAGGAAAGYTVEPVVGFDTTADNTLYIENPLSGQTNIELDFSELALNGSNDLFGVIDTIDISGSGLQEDNTIYLSGQDVLELGAGNGSGDTTVTIDGESGDTVGLVDQDGSSGGSWAAGANDGTYTTYTYNDGVDIATLIIDNDISII